VESWESDPKSGSLSGRFEVLIAMRGSSMPSLPLRDERGLFEFRGSQGSRLRENQIAMYKVLMSILFNAIILVVQN
jgi:hypothetical protein